MAPLNFLSLILLAFSLLPNSIKTAGHISSIQTNIDYLNYGYAKNFELIFKLEHDLPITGSMKIRMPFLIDDGTSSNYFYFFFFFFAIISF